MVSASDIVSSLKAGERRAIDVITEHLAAATASSEMNAFIEIDAEGAKARAITIDGDPANGRLVGVPIALKDLLDHAGHVTSAGSSFYRHHATESATVVDRLEAAGCVVIGRTGLHEFAYGFSSENEWFGAVRNPWDLSLSPGGSSGGSAAAVAAGVVPVALGTDTGGSIRVPAALCGIIGLKVTHGRVPLTGILPLAESLDTVGPLARHMTDIELIYETIRGYDDRDPWSVNVHDEPDRFRGLDGLRVGIPGAWMNAVPTSAFTRTEYSTFTDAISAHGAKCVAIDAPDLTPTPHLVTLSAAEAAGVHRSWFTDIDKRYGPDVEQRLAFAMEITVDQLVEAKRWQARIVQLVREAFANCDVIMTPTVGHNRKTIGVDDIDIDGTLQFYRPVLSGFTSLVNQFSCPAIALPLNRPGIPPPSIQFVAPWWREQLLLDLGAALENIELATVRPPTGLSQPDEPKSSS